MLLGPLCWNHVDDICWSDVRFEGGHPKEFSPGHQLQNPFFVAPWLSRSWLHYLAVEILPVAAPGLFSSFLRFIDGVFPLPPFYVTPAPPTPGLAALLLKTPQRSRLHGLCGQEFFRFSFLFWGSISQTLCRILKGYPSGVHL